jgi:predicted enzyme related to lactoylglutathione lyase
VIDVRGVDYIRVPVTDIGAARRFYGEALGLPAGPTDAGDWVEFQAGRVTLTVMTPETHDYEFAPDVAAAKSQLEAAGVEVSDVWDSGVCNGAGITDPAGNRILLHHRYAAHES